MPCSIKVSSNSDTRYLFEKSFATLEEFKQVKELCKSRERVGFFKSMVIPVRTNSFSNFCEDFFLPTFIHHALKIDVIALKLLMVPACLIYDLVALPIRAITLIPRAIYNAQHARESHPLHQYLKKEGADEQLLSKDHVYVTLYCEETESGRVDKTTEGTNFNFIDLPEPVCRSQWFYSHTAS